MFLEVVFQIDDEGTGDGLQKILLIEDVVRLFELDHLSGVYSYYFSPRLRGTVEHGEKRREKG